MAATDEQRLAQRVRELAQPSAGELGIELLDVTVAGQGARRVVRVVADTTDEGPAGGLDVDAIAALSHRLGEVLDHHDLVPGSYTLEVTSPGVDRPLRQPRDYARNIGRDVALHKATGSPGPSPLSGRLVAADQDQVVIEAAGARVEVPLADIDHGKVVLPW